MPFIHGFHPVREAMRRRPHEVRRVLLTGKGTRAKEITGLCRRHGVTIDRLREAELRDLVPEARQGIAAELGRMTAGAEERFSEETEAGPTAQPAPRPEPGELVVLLEDVQDPRNLGALLRVCEGAGVGRVLIRDRGSAPVSPTVVAASAGATEWIPVERITNTARVLEQLKDGGFWIYGAAAEGAPAWQIDLRGKIVLCFGGEEKGLRRLTRERCDALLGLPMLGRVESLNVATAAAALLYEAVRQRSS